MSDAFDAFRDRNERLDMFASQLAARADAYERDGRMGRAVEDRSRVDDIRGMILDCRSMFRLLTCSGKWSYERNLCEGCGWPDEAHRRQMCAETPEPSGFAWE